MADRLLISGASGLVAGRLTRALLAAGSEVRSLSRAPEKARGRVDDAVEVVGWNGLQIAPTALEGVTGVVHLSGEPIFAGPLSAARRRRIVSSRIDSTRSVVEAIGAMAPSQRPSVLVCASAVGYYGSRGEDLLDEDAAPGEGFLAEVCRDWEAAALSAKGIRVVCLRIGIVLSRAGGALPMLALPFRFGAGGRLGDGKQWVPWIHIDDLVGLTMAVLGDGSYSGPVNAVSPQPLRNRDFTSAVAGALRRPAFLPAPAFVLRLVLGDLADELLGSRRVVPKKALDRGYAFTYASLKEALRAEL